MVGLATALGACVFQPVAQDDPAGGSLALLSPIGVPPEPPRKPVAPARRVVPAPQAEAPAPIDLDGVVGYSELEVRELLGDPAWIEEVPPALSWQYSANDCVLKVFFFMEMATRDFRVLSYDLSSTEDGVDVDERCLSELLVEADERRS